MRFITAFTNFYSGLCVTNCARTVSYTMSFPANWLRARHVKRTVMMEPQLLFARIKS